MDKNKQSEPALAPAAGSAGRGYHVDERNKLVILACIGYRVTAQDGQIIFEEHGGIYGCHTRFAFEKHRDINNTPGIWYLVETDASSDRIPASHIAAAYEYCCDHFGKSFEDPHNAQPSGGAVSSDAASC